MCGIVGVIGTNAAAPIVLKALKKLEYRGYDSAGVASIYNGCLEIRKGVGKLDEVEKSCRLSGLPGISSIGHVRWATHGKVSIENTHPLLDCHHRIAVVHNGIIENFQELRQHLSAKHCFTSETDTEVIAHLIEDEMAECGILEKAVYKAVKQIKGSFAFIVLCSEDPQKIVAARKNSPLVIGVGEKNKFLASDILCFLDQTDRAIHVEDDEIVVLTADGVRILDSQFLEIQRDPIQFDYRAEDATKQGHAFFMEKEILEQPQSIRFSLEQNEEKVMDMAIEMLRARQVVLVGCGTSRNAALIGRYAFSKQAGLFSEVVLGSEFQYFSDSVDKNTVVIAISQSGETADVIHGVKKAKHNGAKVFSVVNNPHSTLARLSDRTLNLQCGPEIAVAATKSFICDLTVFYMLAFAMQNRLSEGIKRLLPLIDIIQENLAFNGSGLASLAAELKDKRDFYYLGRGINYAVAGEGALKLKEVSYVHAEGMSAGELKHGTLALVEPGTPVVVICPGDYTYNETISNVMEAKARGAFIIGVSDQSNPVFDRWIHIPKVEEIFYPLVSVIPLQLMAYHSAIIRGYDPDKPRNLAKSVTVK